MIETFVRAPLGWTPWLEPLPQEEFTDRHLEALVQPARRSSPYFALLARDPDILEHRTRADLDIFAGAEEGLPRAEREYAATVTSRVNGCVFCASVHSRFAVRFDPARADDVDALLADGPEIPLDARWTAITQAVAALAATPVAFGPAHVDALAEAGLDEAEIADLVASASFFHWANRLMLSLGEPEETP